MNVKTIVLSSSPFFDAYIQSDTLGKLIFASLIVLSIWSWVLVIYKVWTTRSVKKSAAQFKEMFDSQNMTPLSFDMEKKLVPSPFSTLYKVMKKHTIDILNKNRNFGSSASTAETDAVSYLSSSDLAYVESHLLSTISAETKKLEKNLFILATIVPLAPFLGLLGTVWGILTTFSQLQSHTSGGVHAMVLGGLSLALATTVLGLIDAIPALIGYNYLKNAIGDFESEMEAFATDILASVEIHYRKVDVS